MDLPRHAWRMSTRSGSSGNCVEVAAPPDLVRVRDSKDRTGSVLSFAPTQWADFISGIKAGRLGGSTRVRD
ncbi:DUF397 domain-containing protein [Micromonospora sagamiensis]|uniref:Uncharacterized protein DUF397 n=1 Tax=Micromonospora sagamiensis TaxID=47875 RepID=A0A562WC87_9ACTN|nr:DUF397 domain-containing protein [Micromonospora sagamiensis]TWJ27758.1 uncharacterized protein DUF397 [Micromonospora sagamiensis]BCL13355.1 hypothetical protein GCM10017556_10940 [Micromonospora sagamiensis]